MTHYNYICVSKSGTLLEGQGVWHKKFDRDQLTQVIMNEVVQIAYISGVAWDPFNIKLVVQAQTGPKPLCNLT